jgi:predicted nucleotidyltransferase
MIPDTVRAEVLRRLHAAEQAEGVRILFAVESGSRAWGFASADSDYDVRFVYVRPQSWYLSIDVEDRRDVIEYPIVDEIDCNGWDVRKALRLLHKSNPAIIEWLQSPIEYLARGTFRAEALRLLPQTYSLAAGWHHYRQMAATNYRGYLRGETVRLKKYFYVLRPLLAARWIERHAAPPPIEFDRLLALLPDEPALRAAIDALLARKRAGAEVDVGAAIPQLTAFIEAELARSAVRFGAAAQPVPDRLRAMNGLFASALQAGAALSG